MTGQEKPQQTVATHVEVHDDDHHDAIPEQPVPSLSLHKEEEDDDVDHTDETFPKKKKQQQQRIQWLKLLILDDRFEVTLRICASMITAYILSFGNFPTVVPVSQTAIIASIGSAFAMAVPTLLFSIGLVVFPGMVTSVIVALLIATGLLAIAAVGGRNAYVVAYFFVALVLAGLRFHPQQSTVASLLLMLIALNTMGPAAAAEQQGLSYVASLWTQKGTENPNAVFRNTMIGMCWIAFCIALGRLIPPARTARNVLTTKLTPKVLIDVAGFIRSIVDCHQGDINNNTGNDDKDVGAGGGDDEKASEVISKIVHSATVTVGGGLAEMTALEPRITTWMTTCQKPVDLVGNLRSLLSAIYSTLTATLALRAFRHAGVEELEVGGLRAVCLDVADRLEGCAKALVETNASHIGATESSSMEKQIDIETGKATNSEPFDPVFLKKRCNDVEEWTKTWIASMDSTTTVEGASEPDGVGVESPTKSTTQIVAASVMPWITNAGLGLIIAIFGNIKIALLPSTWRNIVLAPHTNFPKAWWCFKFALGFTALVCMHVYWPAFRNLEIPVDDEGDPIQGAHFAGWYLIAYAFGTTQTVEGTCKKGTLRALGTMLGGFSAWLAITVCGTNPYGLATWLTVTGTTAAFMGLPQGPTSRLGIPNAAWGYAYFTMTQSLVAVDIYWGVGGKNDITINRIIANCVGIAMAMLVSVIPPSIYGGSPQLAHRLLEEQKKVLGSCIKMMLEESTSESTGSSENLKVNLEALHGSSKQAFMAKHKEINDNFADANQWQNVCLLRLDPSLPGELDRLAILGSSILSLLRTAIRISDCKLLCEQFGKDTEGRKKLEEVLEAIDCPSLDGTPADDVEMPSPPTSTVGQRHVPIDKTFANYCIYLQHVLLKSEENLGEIKWGFF